MTASVACDAELETGVEYAMNEEINDVDADERPRTGAARGRTRGRGVSKPHREGNRRGTRGGRGGYTRRDVSNEAVVETYPDERGDNIPVRGRGANFLLSEGLCIAEAWVTQFKSGTNQKEDGLWAGMAERCIKQYGMNRKKEAIRAK